MITRRFVIVAGVLAIAVGGIVGFDLFKQSMIHKFFANFKMPPAVVATTQAEAKTWHPTLTAVGSLKAVNGVAVSSEVPGMVNKLYFQSGQIVQAGQPLVQLDDAVDQQDLRNLQAKLQLDRLTFEQNRKLFLRHMVSQVAYDTAKSSLQQSEALVDKAKTMIEKKLVRAPFTGKLGIRNVELGQYITPGQPLVSLQSMDPLYLQFSLPEQDLTSVRVNQAVNLTTDTIKDAVFSGQVTAIDSVVDPATRTIQIQATVPNKDLRLYPGVFANVSLPLAEQQKVVTVPQTAITYSLYGDSIYVLKPEGKTTDGQPKYIATEQYVKLGDHAGNEVAVLQGIDPGALVVSAGQLKLHNKSEVTVNNAVKVG